MRDPKAFGHRCLWKTEDEIRREVVAACKAAVLALAHETPELPYNGIAPTWVVDREAALAALDAVIAEEKP